MTKVSEDEESENMLREGSGLILRFVDRASWYDLNMHKKLCVRVVVA